MKRMAPRLQMLYPKWNLAMGKHLGKLQGNEESNYLGRCIGNRLWAGKSEFVAWRCVKIWVAQKWLLWKCARKRLSTDCLDSFPFNQSIACRYSERSERVSSLFGWLKCFKYCISYLGAWYQIGIAVVFFSPRCSADFAVAFRLGDYVAMTPINRASEFFWVFHPGPKKFRKICWFSNEIDTGGTWYFGATAVIALCSIKGHPARYGWSPSPAGFTTWWNSQHAVRKPWFVTRLEIDRNSIPKKFRHRGNGESVHQTGWPGGWEHQQWNHQPSP